MKIAFILNHFLPHQVAGTEVYTWSLAKALKAIAHDVCIITPHYDTNEDDNYFYDGLRVLRYAEPNIRQREFITGKKAPLGLINFIELLKEENPDIANIHELTTSTGIGMFHLKALKQLNIPVVITLHLAGYTCYCGTLLYKDQVPCDGKIRIGQCTKCALSRLNLPGMIQGILYNASMPLYKLNINPSAARLRAGTALSYPFIIEELKQRLALIANYSEKIVVLTQWFKRVLEINEIPSSKISLIKQALPVPATTEPETTVTEKYTDLRLVFIGRLHPAKGLYILIKALQNLSNVSLDIYGDGRDGAYKLSLEKEAALNPKINFKGLVQQKNIIATLQLYDALVIPSMVCEMAPLLIQEAFAAKLPVIGSNVKGIAEQVTHDYNGLLFSMGKADELQTVIGGLIKDRNQLKKFAGNIIPPREFSKVAEETEQVFTAILSKQHKAIV